MTTNRHLQSITDAAPGHRGVDRRTAVFEDGFGGSLLGLVLAAMLFVLLGAVGLPAAEPPVKAIVDRNRISISESIRLQVILTGIQGQVDVSGIADFDIVSRRTSTSIQVVNGSASKSLIYTYSLLPLKKGHLQIPSLPVTDKGQMHMTRPITVEVTADGNDAGTRADVMVRARTSEQRPYQGQQFLYTLTVYHAESLRNVRLEKPSFEGFTVNSIEEQKTGSTVINGRPFRSIQLAWLLIPVHAGPRVIEPSVLRCDIIRPPSGSPRSMFDNFFDNDPVFGRGRLEPRLLRTEQVAVDVRPLPPYNGEGRFSGLVGRFEIRSELDTNQLAAGESTTLTVTIAGRGNIVDAELPDIRLPAHFKIYRDRPEESIQLAAEGFAGEKIYRIALVPMQPGNYVIDPIQCSYFDTAQGRYRDLATRPKTLAVLPGKQTDAVAVFQPPSAPAPSLKKGVEFIGRDILPPKEDLNALKTNRRMSSALFIGLMLSPALVFAAIVLMLNLNRSRDDAAGRMIACSRRALKSAESSLSDPQQYPAYLHRAISAAILARARKTGESLTYAEAEDILKQTAVAPQQMRTAVAMLSRLDSMRYGGAHCRQGKPQDLLKQTRQLIRQLTI